MLVSAIIFITIDSFYLNIFKGYFFKQIQSVQGTQPKLNFLTLAVTKCDLN